MSHEEGGIDGIKCNICDRKIETIYFLDNDDKIVCPGCEAIKIKIEGDNNMTNWKELIENTENKVTNFEEKERNIITSKNKEGDTATITIRKGIYDSLVAEKNHVIDRILAIKHHGVNSISIPPNLEVTLQYAKIIKSLCYDAYNNEICCPATLEWRSDHRVTVQKGGIVTGVECGDTIVRANVGPIYSQ